MADDRAVVELDSFLTERADHLMRAAMLLTGSREAGQDLLQTALERLLRHWRTLSGDPEAYLRRTLYNLAADGFRRQGRLQRKLLLLRAETTVPGHPRRSRLRGRRGHRGCGHPRGGSGGWQRAAGTWHRDPGARGWRGRWRIGGQSPQAPGS